MPIRFWTPAILAICSFACAAPTRAQILNPENGHYYTQAFAFQEATWEQARTNASQMTFGGVSGHLVTITSAAEQAFIESKILSFEKIWLGAFQPPGSPEPAGNWQWVTGEPFDYTHWRFSEPNDLQNLEHLLEMFPFEGTWNDVGVNQGPIVIPGPPGDPNRRRYVVEFDTPEPVSALSILYGAAVLVLIRHRRV